MNVSEFNRTVAREKITAPADAEVRILEFKEGEVKVEVLGRTTWVKALKRAYRAPNSQCTRTQLHEKERPSSSIDKDELALEPSEFKLLYWMRSLSSCNFSISYAARELNMSTKTVRKCLRSIRERGRMVQ